MLRLETMDTRWRVPLEQVESLLPRCCGQVPQMKLSDYRSRIAMSAESRTFSLEVLHQEFERMERKGI